MTLPSIDGLHYVGCHCNDICACSDPIECIHEQCICDQLRAAYQRGREDERVEKAPVVLLSFRRPITDKQYRRITAAVVAAGGTVNAHD